MNSSYVIVSAGIKGEQWGRVAEFMHNNVKGIPLSPNFVLLQGIPLLGNHNTSRNGSRFVEVRLNKDEASYRLPRSFAQVLKSNDDRSNTERLNGKEETNLK